jgi:hypothetical protein
MFDDESPATWERGFARFLKPLEFERPYHGSSIVQKPSNPRAKQQAAAKKARKLTRRKS